MFPFSTCMCFKKSKWVVVQQGEKTDDKVCLNGVDSFWSVAKTVDLLIYLRLVNNHFILKTAEIN